MLTAQQQRLLTFIEDRLKQSGVSPSFDEMKDALGLKSKSGVHRLIKALEERGFIQRLPNRARALEVVRSSSDLGDSSAGRSEATIVEGNFGSAAPGAPQPAASTNETVRSVGQDDYVSVPLHGRIAAGTPIEALENNDLSVSIPATMVGRSSCYALEVSGDSMIEKGILDGDTVIIERCQSARDGEIVVALVDREEATLKTLKRAGSHVALVPANRDFETQIYEPDRIMVQGRLVGLMRQYH